MAEGVTPAEGLPTHEPPSEIQRFTQEAREALASRFDIYELEGRSFRELQESKGDVAIFTDFWRSESGKTGGDQLMDSLDAMRSERTEVAIPKSGAIFLPNSDANPQAQKGIFEDYASQTSEAIPGTEVIEGDTLDFVELGLKYAQKTDGRSLYGAWNNRRMAAARSGLNVGSMPKDPGNPAEIKISHMRGGMNNEGPWVAPLIVPARASSPTPTPR